MADLELAMPVEGVSYPLNVQYCGLCKMPLEYCSYSGDLPSCQAWLEKNIPDVFAKMYVSEGDKKEKDGEDAEDAADDKKKTKRGGKGSKAAAAVGKAGPVKKLGEPNITVQRSMRGKNKSLTVIKGMSTAGIDAKVAAKAFSKKFACSSSATGQDEIVVQGDVKDDLFDFIPETWPNVSEDHINDLGDVKR